MMTPEQYLRMCENDPEMADRIGIQTDDGLIRYKGQELTFEEFLEQLSEDLAREGKE